MYYQSAQFYWEIREYSLSVLLFMVMPTGENEIKKTPDIFHQVHADLIVCIVIKP